MAPARRAPMARSRSTQGRGMTPSALGPTLSRKLPPLLTMSISPRTRLAEDFQFSSKLRYPHESLVVFEYPELYSQLAGPTECEPAYAASFWSLPSRKST